MMKMYVIVIVRIVDRKRVLFKESCVGIDVVKAM